MIALPSPNILGTASAMTTSELAAWAQVARIEVPHLVNRFGIWELTVHAKTKLLVRCDDPADCGAIA